ncbi:MAG: F0F1 ATP synthase subunit delta [Treponema sp.]|jgi:F-type H+-transporting ATPase subunit delta|nr:F0F1 ATP synthase subunit delta [Treponema sp.]
MFNGERWATGFIGSCGVHAEAGLEALKALVPVIAEIPGTLRGTAAARELEGMIRKAVKEAPESWGLSELGVEYAVRIILLLVKRGYFTHAPALISAVELLLDQQQGILRVTVESAFPVDASFQNDLKTALAGRSRTGAYKIAVKEIEVMVHLVPELLGGYRLRIGSELIDVSLRTQLHRLARDLQVAPPGGTSSRETRAGGGFSW